MSYGPANRYRAQVHCVDCGKPIDRQAYRCRPCARTELIAFKAQLPKPPKPEPVRPIRERPQPESAEHLDPAGWTKGHDGIWRHDGTAA